MASGKSGVWSIWFKFSSDVNGIFSESCIFFSFRSAMVLQIQSDPFPIGKDLLVLLSFWDIAAPEESLVLRSKDKIGKVFSLPHF